MFKSKAFPDITFEHDNNRLFADYWASLPKVDLVPMRTSFNPRDVPEILSTFTIHEMKGAGEIYLRLAGTSVVALFGMEVTGQNYLELVHPTRWEKVERALNHIVARPCAMIVFIRSVRNSTLESFSESIGFPFRDAEGRITQVIYQANPLELQEYWDYRSDRRETSRATRRAYIDIGAGIPDWDHSEDAN